MNTATEGGTQPHKELAESLQAIKSSRVFVLTSQTEPNCPVLESDLAARNILVSAKELCKVADLGQAVELPKEGDKCHVITDTTKIPIRWCAPEYLKEMKCSVASDVWSFGVLMWEMANPGKIPYDNFSNSEVLQKIRAGYTLTIPSLYPKEVQNILKLCWNHDVKKRPDFLHIFMHLNRVNFAKYRKT